MEKRSKWTENSLQCMWTSMGEKGEKEARENVRCDSSRDEYRQLKLSMGCAVVCYEALTVWRWRWFGSWFDMQHRMGSTGVQEGQFIYPILIYMEEYKMRFQSCIVVTRIPAWKLACVLA